MNQIFAQLFYEMEKHRDTVLVTLIDAAGSAPRKSGSQMLVGANGRLTGTIGGGAVERRSEEMAHGPAEGEALCRPRFSAAHRRLQRRYRHGVRRRRDGPFPVHPGGGCVVAGAGLGPDRAAHRPSAGLAGAAGGRRLRRSAGAGGSAVGRSS